MLKDVKREIESIHIKLEQVEALHRIVIDNYFQYNEKQLRPDSPAMYDLLLAYPDYSAVLDISFDYIRNINERLQAVIDTLYGTESTTATQ